MTAKKSLRERIGEHAPALKAGLAEIDGAIARPSLDEEEARFDNPADLGQLGSTLSHAAPKRAYPSMFACGKIGYLI